MPCRVHQYIKYEKNGAMQELHLYIYIDNYRIICIHIYL